MPYLIRWSYVLGVTCALVALLWRGMMTLGYFVPDYISLGRTIYDMSFYKGALLFLLIAIASASHEESRERHRAMRRRRELAAE
jgi:DMSO/TMAO reductase YedYZ heme-binding membrane subunit